MNDRPTPETDAEHAQFAMGGFTLDFCRKLERERDKARDALQRIADCDFVITLPDRMDAVRKIANDALNN